MAGGRGKKTSGVGDAGALFVEAAGPASTPPHFHGHRERLRERFNSAGPDALADYELLELLLFRMIPRRDTKPVAKALIERFGDFAAVLGADPDRLAETPDVGPAVARDLKIVQAALERAARVEARKRPSIGSWSKLVDYCRVAMQNERQEQFRVLFLDVKNQLIADEVLGVGTIDHAPVYPREVVRRALELRAAAVVLAHNHPSGDPTPSAADVAMTKEVAKAAGALGVKVHDHVIVGRQGVASLRALGLF